MRILDHTNLESRLIEGLKGSMTALDVIGDESNGVGVRVIPAHSKVPKPGTAVAKGKRVLFVLRGSGTLSNGEYYEKLSAGKFALMDEGENPNYMTQDEELVLLEFRYDASGKITPPPTMASPLAMVTETKPAKVMTYDSVD